MGAFATSNPTGSSDVTGSGTANQVSVWASASSLTVGSIPFTSSATGYTIGSLVAEPGGILTLTSTTQGFIPPRLTTAQAALIASPVAGVTLYNTDLGSLVTYTGAAFKASILNGGNLFGADISIGTLDHQAIKFLINGSEIWRMNGTNGYLSNTAADATAQIELASATATTLAPIRLTSGNLIGTPLAGAIEFLTDSYYATITTGTARRTIAFIDGGQTFSSAIWQGSSISTTYTDAKIKGSLTGTAGLISYNNGTADTETNTANFKYDSVNSGFIVGTTAMIATTDIGLFDKSQNGQTLLKVRNANASGAALAGFTTTNGTTLTNIYQSGTGYTTSGNFVANQFVIASTGAGGIINYSNHASGNIYFYTNATERMRIVNSGGIYVLDGNNFLFDTITGTKFATSTTQKISFWNKTPIVQPTTGITGATLVSNGGTTITSTDTLGGYTLQQLAAVIINTGLAA